MNAWVLSHLSSSPGTKITMQMLTGAGLDVEHVSPQSLNLTLNEADGRLALGLLPERQLPDLVYTRLGSSAPARALDVVRHVEAMGARVVNGSSALERCRDKFRSYQLMAQHGLPVPPTTLVGLKTTFEDLSRQLGEPPYIVKLPVGTKGTGVSIVDTRRSLRSVLDMLAALDQRVLVQRFVAEAAGTDVRVMVFDGEACFAVRRRASGDEFRSNIHLGGADSAEELDPVVKSVAERAARAHGLRVAGVDILESNNGPMIAEVNGSPGLAGPYKQYGEELQHVFTRFVRSVLSDAS